MPHIAIIGGGIAGPVAALRLSSLPNMTITVYERSPTPRTIGGAINVAPNGMRLLERLGLDLDRKIRAVSATVPAMIMVDDYGVKIGEFNNTDKSGLSGVRIMRSALQAVLLGECGRKENVTVMFDKKLLSIRETEDKVVVVFTDGTEISADYVIGADGIHSSARSYVLGEEEKVEPRYTGQSIIYGMLPTSTLPNADFSSMPVTSGILARKGMFMTAFTTEAREEIYWVDVSHKPEPMDKTLIDPSQIRTETLGRFGNLFAPIPDIVKHTKEFFAWPAYELPSLKTWSRGRVVLIGDAAHALPPNMGQGASIAMEDVFLLARVIETHFGDQMFTRYEALRRPRIDAFRKKIKPAQGKESERSYVGQVLMTWGAWAFLKAYAMWDWLGFDSHYGYDPDSVEV